MGNSSSLPRVPPLMLEGRQEMEGKKFKKEREEEEEEEEEMPCPFEVSFHSFLFSFLLYFFLSIFFLFYSPC